MSRRRSHPPITPDRLLSAADAILLAGHGPGLIVHIPPAMHQGALRAYTDTELREAAQFLARLGMVDLVRTPDFDPRDR